MSDPESFDEQLARVRLMTGDSGTWDLSDNDRAALGALLEAYRTARWETATRCAEIAAEFSRTIPYQPNTADSIDAAIQREFGLD